ncbi:hypothetical protein [Pseudoalteromonas lipolytica]|uniref:hypothetical protein n=1 Tax=Pseudoalteromonas lipolytica TaxID=570156 RepID=UPI0030A3B16A
MINLESNEARWAGIANLLQEINDRLCELYKRDSVYVDSPALYKALVKLNDKLLCMIAKKPIPHKRFPLLLFLIYLKQVVQMMQA